MLRKAVTIISFIGLVVSVVLWGLSFWNLEYTHGSFQLSLSGGGLIYLEHPQLPDDQGCNFDGWSRWTPTHWWPAFYRWPSHLSLPKTLYLL